MSEQTEPWRVVKRDDYTQRQTNIGVLIDGHVYELGDVNNESNRINAHILAAAREMLAALERAEEYMRTLRQELYDSLPTDCPMPDDGGVMDEIRSAIRKAKGGTK